jgi:ferredoxin
MPSRFEVVEEDCIGCGLCPERAPENFEIPAGTSIAQVLKQPETPAEEEACREAFDYCPIGGLQMITPDSSPADCTAGGPHPTSIPAGCPTPGHFTATRQES